MSPPPPNKPHPDAPRIVKLSGGRSSGMMLMEMLRQNTLKSERGDVVVFNNTSAEHPATYEFVRKIKQYTERKYNIPFFWIEYQTYEDAGRHGWRRNPTYRLVNDQPHSAKNKTGYSYKGEVFEEVISLGAFLPNIQNRNCTLNMKIFTTNAFLSDWFAQKPGIERQGHYGETARMTGADVINSHQANRGATPDDIIKKKREFVMGRDFIRQPALWKDFTDGKLGFNNKKIKASVLGGKGQLFGDNAISYVSCLGLRKDEEIRVEKIKARITHARNGKLLTHQPLGEFISAPLIDTEVSQQKVIEFWKKQPFDLDLSEDGIWSNCVYCPLKGRAKLLRITKNELSLNGVDSTTPASIDWWIKMEKKYIRDLKAEKRTITSENGVKYIGFFGAADKLDYHEIKQQAKPKKSIMTDTSKSEYMLDESHVPCNCTD